MSCELKRCRLDMGMYLWVIVMWAGTMFALSNYYD